MRAFGCDGASRGKCRRPTAARRAGTANRLPRCCASARRLVDAIGPVAPPPSSAQHHDLGAGERALHIDVDRHRMAERDEIGEAAADGKSAGSSRARRRRTPQARCRRPTGRRCRPALWPRSSASPAPSSGLRLSRESRCTGASSDCERAPMALRSSPFSPITTSAARVLAIAPGSVERMIDARTDRLHDDGATACRRRAHDPLIRSTPSWRERRRDARPHGIERCRGGHRRPRSSRNRRGRAPRSSIS